MNQPFSSLATFKQQFNQGLHQLLDTQQLGTFILCLANASNDGDLFEALKGTLKTHYSQLLNLYKSALLKGQPIDAVEEDLLVFLKLQLMGFDNIGLTQHRVETHWACQHNTLRAFRPQRLSAFKHNGDIFTPFVKEQFNFNKPYIQKECFWSGELEGQPFDLFYNKYPFAALHGLMVPDRKRGLPQLLVAKWHHTVWQITRGLSANLPGLAMGYNSYGAYASVNHLHFQMFINKAGLPISHAQWQHNGGTLAYPIKVTVSDDPHESWQMIKALHEKKQAYNLLYMPNKLYIIPRQQQGRVAVPAWSSGFTWFELSGAMILSNQSDYTALSEQAIEQLIKAHAVDDKRK